ncbi:MAG: DUF1697 domain-containing protein [Devosiaceae bacterium]|nr:DUF1697 domain-containing protein [Devosiaceae bacterium]
MSEQFVAFLRGANLGKRNIKINKLRAVFTDLGLHRVLSVIVSGNVLTTRNWNTVQKIVKKASK